MIEQNHLYGNLWIQGGPRARGCSFADDPKRAPALNKIPLVKWRQALCLCQFDPHDAAARAEPCL